MISIIMASYLGAYKNAATNRPDKLRRAIASVLLQKYGDWELIVISDGCNETSHIVSQYKDERISCYQIPKQEMWSGVPRNVGISKAIGDYIIYLDNDDMFGPAHLHNIAAGIHNAAGFQWYFFNDLVPDGLQPKQFIERRAELQRFHCGSSNIAHKSDMLWNVSDTYEHDWHFISKLKKQHSYARITGAQYMVCHIPKQFDL